MIVLINLLRIALMKTQETARLTGFDECMLPNFDTPSSFGLNHGYLISRFKVDFSIGAPTDNRRKQLKTVPFIVTNICIYLFAGKEIGCPNGQRH